MRRSAIEVLGSMDPSGLLERFSAHTLSSARHAPRPPEAPSPPRALRLSQEQDTRLHATFAATARALRFDHPPTWDNTETVKGDLKKLHQQSFEENPSTLASFFTHALLTAYLSFRTHYELTRAGMRVANAEDAAFAQARDTLIPAVLRAKDATYAVTVAGSTDVAERWALQYARDDLAKKIGKMPACRWRDPYIAKRPATRIDLASVDIPPSWRQKDSYDSFIVR